MNECKLPSTLPQRTYIGPTKGPERGGASPTQEGRGAPHGLRVPNWAIFCPSWVWNSGMGRENLAPDLPDWSQLSAGKATMAGTLARRRVRACREEMGGCADDEPRKEDSAPSVDVPSDDCARKVQVKGKVQMTPQGPVLVVTPLPVAESH